MSRHWLSTGGVTLLGLALVMRTLAGDDSNATVKQKNAAILHKLDKPIPLKVKDLPLQEVFDYVKKATAEPGDTDVPIYVDPAALARAHVLISTPITYESKEGEPLKVSLSTVLGRLGLRYRVEEGSLRISGRMGHLLDREPQTKAILDRLEAKVDLTFENTSLEDVLKQVKKATSKGSVDKGIPIYVDPVGLSEAERTLETPISFASKGEPLKSSLERLLKSVGLTYNVKDGLLTVTSPD